MKLLHICESKCFICQGGYEAHLTVHEARLMAYEAALRAMKRSLGRLHVFLPGGKKMVGVKTFDTITSLSHNQV